ncbi:MAG: nucleotidyltransferase family protein [Bacteroidetes bacterium]|nr:nucleotidyltransferase family protein [Bacteroidota bacterium]
MVAQDAFKGSSYPRPVASAAPMTSLKETAHSYGPEAATLLQMARLVAATPAAAETFRLLEAPISAGILHRRLTAHGLTGIGLPAGLLQEVFDSQTYAAWARAERQSAAWNLHLFEEQRLLDGLLSSLSLPYIYAKGLLLGWAFHGDLTTRATRDIDVMVRPADLPAFRGLLAMAGYEEVYFFPEQHLCYGRWLNREAVFRKSVSDGVYVHVELQWSPVLSFYRIPIAADQLLEHRQWQPLGGVQWPLPSVESHLTILLLHHGVMDGWRQLRHLLDLCHFLKAMGGAIDWPRYQQKLIQMGISVNASAGFSLCRSLLGMQVPEGFAVDDRVLKRLEESLLSGRPLLRDQRSLAFLRRQWLLADGFRGRCRVCLGQLQKAVSPGLYELEAIPLLPRFFALYYGLKPFRPLLRPFLKAHAGKGIHE